MLDLDDISILSEDLAPPAGYFAQDVLAATYSLDPLLALGLTLPFVRGGELAGQDIDGVPMATLLHAVRRKARELRVLCDASRVQAISRREAVLLNDVIVPLTVPAGPTGRRPNFHPKFVLVAFAATGPGPHRGKTRLRLVCMSRNLSQDTSRDVAVVLDGEVGDAPLEENVGFANWLERLLSWSPDPRRRAASAPLVERLATLVRTVRWKAPAGFHRVAVWPLGSRAPVGHPLRREARERVAIVSPFVDATTLRHLAAPEGTTLISNRSALERLSGDALADVSTYCPHPCDVDLHAKLYVFESRRHRRWIIGSANATRPATNDNAELVVELRGTARAPGIDSLLAPTSLGGVVDLYEVPAGQVGTEAPVPTPTEIAFARLADHVAVGLVHHDARSDACRVEITFEPPVTDLGVDLSVKLADHGPVPLNLDRTPCAVLDRVKRKELIPFLVVTSSGEDPIERSLMLRLEGVTVTDLSDELLRDELERSTGGPLSYIWEVLLGIQPPLEEVPDLDDDEGGPLFPEGDGSGARSLRSPDPPLLETLLKALDPAVDPERLDEIGEIVKAFGDENASVADFRELWTAIEEARPRR